jgi:hypothetical protein
MPEICRFFGIIVAMYYRDHAPPHFHVRYSGHRAAFALQPLRLLEGNLPARALGLVMEWASRHEPELLDDWGRAARAEPLRRIAPLE